MDVASSYPKAKVSKMRFRFHGKQEALDIVDTHKELSFYLANQDAECSLIDSDIKIGKILGQGKFGAAFVITTPEFGPKEYAAKRLAKEVGTVESEVAGSLKEIAQHYSRVLHVSVEAIIKLNQNIHPNNYFEEGDLVYIPTYAKACLTTEDQTIQPFDPEGEVTFVPKGSYVCEDETYPEFIIGSLCGNLFKQEISANFFDMFGFATCPNKGEVNQYVFMEKVDGTLHELIKKPDEEEDVQPESEDVRPEPEDVRPEPEEIASLVLQTIHAIGVYQQKYRIQHTDLSAKNVFYQKVNPTTKFAKNKISQANYFHYKVAGVNLYLPAARWIAKIGDYGMAVKYSDPLIAPEPSLIGDENIPGWYTQNYDILYFLCNMFYITDENFLVEKLLRHILKVEEGGDIVKPLGETFNMENGRPELWTLGSYFKDITPRSLLTNKMLVGEYMKEQKNSVFMGEF